METKHTPTIIINTCPQCGGTIDYNGQYYPSLVDPVRACNNYEGLLAALKLLYNDWQTLIGEDLKENCQDVMNIDKCVCAAITEAEKQ
jgi:hypothetical protein